MARIDKINTSINVQLINIKHRLIYNSHPGELNLLHPKLPILIRIIYAYIVLILIKLRQ